MRTTGLCVGGPMDGEVRIVDGSFFVAHRLVPAEDFLPQAPISTELIRYELFQLAGEREMFSIFAPVGTSGDEILTQLIANYRPKVDA